MKRQLLVLTENVEGGEWIATKRLTGAVSKFFPEFKFTFLAFGKDIKHADDFGFLGFLRAFILDYKTVKQTLEEKIETTGVIDYLITTNYVFLLASLRVKKLNSVKKIFYFHGFKSRPIKNHRHLIIRFIEWLSLLQSDYIITVCKFNWPFGLLKKVYIVPNSVPDDFYEEHIKTKEDQKTILYSGRVAAHKGLENLIESFNMYSKKHKNTRLVLCYPKSSADRELLQILKNYVQEFRLGKKIFFKTDLKISDLKKTYGDSDLTILPSEIEMGPLSIIESLACRTPAIGTRVGNIPEILNKINSRLILENNSPSEIASKLTWFFNLTFNELESIREKGYGVSKFYSSFNSAKKFVEILESFK